MYELIERVDQDLSPKLGKNNQLRTNHPCAICGTYGHYTHHCPHWPEFREVAAKTNANPTQGQGGTQSSNPPTY